MGFYSRHVLPKLINTACSQKPMMELRAAYVPRAKGRVMEIGMGSGLNLEFYGPEVDSVTGLDPAVELMSDARKRAEKLPLAVDFLEVSGEQIPAEDNSFDTLVCTWTLCSIPNVYLALSEMRRVLKNKGELIFLEHGKAPDKAVERWQHRIEPLWKIVGGGCHLSRKTDQLLLDAGFSVNELEQSYMPGPKFAAYMYRGVATPR